MPWTEKQNRLFRAAAHNPAIAASHHMSQQKAGEMAGEGIKSSTGEVRKKTLVRHLRGGGVGGIGGGGTGSVGSV